MLYALAGFGVYGGGGTDAGVLYGAGPEDGSEAATVGAYPCAGPKDEAATVGANGAGRESEAATVGAYPIGEGAPDSAAPQLAQNC